VRGSIRTAVLFAAGVLFLAGPAHAGNPQHAGLQVALRAQGLYCGPIDGILGVQTRGALKAFQKRAGLPVDGIAGAKTRIALGPLGRPLFGKRTIRRGLFGWDVSVLQFLLTRDGVYTGPIDGFLGPETEAALRRWQRSTKRLAADGVAGPRTLSMLGTRTRTPLARRDVPAHWYVVQRGDTLTSIAARFGTSVVALARANRVDPRAILPERKRLKIPAARPHSLRAAPSTVRDTLTRWAGRYSVDPTLVRALAWMESGYQPNVVSSAGARGVLQLLPVTRQYVETVLLGGRRLPHTLDGDVQAGVILLRHHLRSFRGDERLALAAWYQGERGVRQQGVLAETKQFVANVLALKSRV
jgi:peptidoglycan hydrolase-like protein with peptidoglycan-binding domain